jgi:hypothetical protein
MEHHKPTPWPRPKSIPELLQSPKPNPRLTAVASFPELIPVATVLLYKSRVCIPIPQSPEHLYLTPRTASAYDLPDESNDGWHIGGRRAYRFRPSRIRRRGSERSAESRARNPMLVAGKRRVGKRGEDFFYFTSDPDRSRSVFRLSIFSLSPSAQPTTRSHQAVWLSPL